MWSIYLDRNAWLKGEALATADTLASAKAKADDLGGRYVASGQHGRTYRRDDLASSWRKA